MCVFTLLLIGLHTNYKLMEELKECKAALKKELEGAPHVRGEWEKGEGDEGYDRIKPLPSCVYVD